VRQLAPVLTRISLRINKARAQRLPVSCVALAGLYVHAPKTQGFTLGFAAPPFQGSNLAEPQRGGIAEPRAQPWELGAETGQAL